MLSAEDIQKLIEAQQEIFATKNDLFELEGRIQKSFSGLQSGVDAYAKKADTYF